MSYVKPHDACSPKTMTLDRVLIDGAGERETSYALQLWHRPNQPREYSIGIRWNGDSDRPIGTPNINGYPCWFVLDRRLWPAVLAMIEERSLRDYAVEKLYGRENAPDTAGVSPFEPVDLA